MNKHRSGVYRISNLATGDFYIGSSVQIHIRWSQHRRDLRAGVHSSPILQRAWNKYGETAFEFAVIEECPRETVVSLEDEYLKAYKPIYNCSATATGGRKAGFRHGIETRAKMSTSAKASPHTRGWHRSGLCSITDLSREKMRLAKLGKPGNHTQKHSAETKAKISASKRKLG